jgi:hypothetical protein
LLDPILAAEESKTGMSLRDWKVEPSGFSLPT